MPHLPHARLTDVKSVHHRCWYSRRLPGAHRAPQAPGRRIRAEGHQRLTSRLVAPYLRPRLDDATAASSCRSLGNGPRNWAEATVPERAPAPRTLPETRSRLSAGGSAGGACSQARVGDRAGISQARACCEEREDGVRLSSRRSPSTRLVAASSIDLAGCRWSPDASARTLFPLTCGRGNQLPVTQSAARRYPRWRAASSSLPAPRLHQARALGPEPEARQAAQTISWAGRLSADLETLNHARCFGHTQRRSSDQACLIDMRAQRLTRLPNLPPAPA